VSLHVRKSACPVRPVFSHPPFDVEQRIVTAQLGPLTVASIYVPNGGKDFATKTRFLDALAQWVAQQHQEGRQLLLCGDLNVTRSDVDVHEKERDSSALGQTPAERAQLERVLGHGLVDLGQRFATPETEAFTWWAPWRNHRERNIGWRIDYALVSQSLLARATACAPRRLFGNSDHAPLTAQFDGPLFAPASVVEGPPEEPLPLDKPAKAQLSLF
jgi:exodeoxyribonuclease-3